jgi:hypothetical protein
VGLLSLTKIAKTKQQKKDKKKEKNAQKPS